MDINRANMDTLFQSYSVAFSDGMQSAGSRPTPEDLMVDDIAMLAPASGAATIHAWLCQIGAMREWVGDRVLSNLETGKLTISNRDFEKTVTVPRNDIEDDQYGIHTPLVRALGITSGSLWLKLASDAVVSNKVWADGKAFFVANRKYGDNTINNIGTIALSATTFNTARVAMESMVLHGNEPGEVVARTLVVGPSLRETGWNIVKNEWVASGTGTATIKNPQQGACELRINRRWVGANANKWALFGEQGGIKPVYIQKRKEPTLTRMDNVNDENVFMRKDFYYGTDARGEAFLTLPHLAYYGNVAG